MLPLVHMKRERNSCIKNKFKKNREGKKREMLKLCTADQLGYECQIGSFGKLQKWPDMGLLTLMSEK